MFHHKVDGFCAVLFHAGTVLAGISRHSVSRLKQNRRQPLRCRLWGDSCVDGTFFFTYIAIAGKAFFRQFGCVNLVLEIGLVVSGKASRKQHVKDITDGFLVSASRDPVLDNRKKDRLKPVP